MVVPTRGYMDTHFDVLILESCSQNKKHTLPQPFVLLWPIFIQNHFNHIKCGTDMPNGQSRIELYKEIDTHYNRQHCACEILSMSKVIMNEVMCLAEDIGADIEYTDTDSMHIDFDKVDALALQAHNKPCLLAWKG